MARVQLWKRGNNPTDPSGTTDTGAVGPDPGPAGNAGDQADSGKQVEVDGSTMTEAPEDGPEDGPESPADKPGILARLTGSTPVLLVVTAHPRQTILTAAALASVALVSGRPAREAAIVLATVLVGQAILGWHNDLVDRERDALHEIPRKPLADGRLDPGNAWYALIVALLLVIPLSISVGVTAGTFYLASLIIAIVGNVALRRGRLSPLPWMASYALFPFYLSYGGYGGDAEVAAPEPAMVVFAALLGLGVHFLRAIWGLVEDDRDGWTYLPLVLGRRLGATRLLVVATTYTAIVVAMLGILGSTVGLRQ